LLIPRNGILIASVSTNILPEILRDSYYFFSATESPGPKPSNAEREKERESSLWKGIPGHGLRDFNGAKPLMKVFKNY
jgi:hypothetical protein